MPSYTIHEYKPLLDSSNMTPGHWVKIANDIAAVFARLFHTSALKCDLGKFCGIEKLGAEQMMIAFLNFGIDAPDRNSGGNE